MGKTADQILEAARKRELFPTPLSSAELREVARKLGENALFSARCTSVNFISDLANVLDDYLAGNINLADARMRLVKSLRSLGYDPAVGFPDAKGVVKPAVKGSLRDLSSAKRLNLILETQKSLVYGAAQKTAGMRGVEFERYPAWELVRKQHSAVPRGYKRIAGQLVPVPGESWPERWTSIGGTLYDGDRMIALKTDPIWEELGSSDNFDDALDVDCPPFAFNSGWGWRMVKYTECDELGIDYSGQHEPEDGDTPLTGEPPAMGTANIPPDLLNAARQFLRARLDGDVLRAEEIDAAWERRAA